MLPKAALPPITLTESDIDSALCRRCAACCRVQVRVPDTDSRYRVFLRAVGFPLLPPPAEGRDDCCDGRHDVTLDLGDCTHLERSAGADGELRFHCKLYGTDRFPKMCADYNCVGWAKASGVYNEDNKILRAAQRASKRWLSAESSPKTRE